MKCLLHRVRCIFWKHSSWHEGQANCLNFLPICNPELLLSTVEIIFSASCILQKRPFIAGIKLQGVCSSISVLFLSSTVVMFDSLTAFCHLCTLTAVWKGTCCCVGWHILFGSLHEFSADVCVSNWGNYSSAGSFGHSPSPLALPFFFQRWPLYIIPLKWLCLEGWTEGQCSHLSKQDQWAMCFPLGSNKRKGLSEEKTSTKDQN